MKRGSTRIAAAFGGLALWLCAPCAMAQPKPDGDVATAGQADAIFRRANELYKSDNFAEAKRLYEQAFALKRAHDIAANLGYAEMKLGLHRDAAEHLAFAVKSWPPTGSEDKRKYAVERFEAEKNEVGALRVRVGTPGAAVFVDQRRVATSPVEDVIFVDPGQHVVRVTLAGYADAARPVTATKGAEQELRFDLVATAAPGTSAGPPNALVIGTGVAGVVLLAGGVAFTLVANGKSSDATAFGKGLAPDACAHPSASESAVCNKLKGALSDQDTFANLARIGFIGGGALALTTVGLAVWSVSTPKSATPSTGARLVPVVSPSTGGLVIVGSF